MASTSTSRRHSSDVKLVSDGQLAVPSGGTVVEVMVPPGTVVVGWPGAVVVVAVAVVLVWGGRVVVLVVVVAVAPTGAVQSENSDVLPSGAVAVAVRINPAASGLVRGSEKLAWPEASVVTVVRVPRRVSP